MFDKFCIEFSGGKDSTALLFKMLEKGKHIDKVIRVDFELDYPDLLKHIADVEKQAKKCQPDIQFVTLNLRSEWDDRIVRLGYPSARYRWCTTRKVNAINRETKNSIVAVGIAYDERERMFVSPNKARIFVFPLVEMQMTEQDCLDYCYSLGFDFYGLYKIRERVSCYCCPFISDNEVLNMPKDLEDNIIKFENICHHYKHQRWKIFFTESFMERKNRLLEERKK